MRAWGRCQTGQRRNAIEPHGASATLPLLAARFGPGEPQVLAQQSQKRLAIGALDHHILAGHHALNRFIPIRVMRVDALYFLEEYPLTDSFETIHIYYSDPWPKHRHHRRRLWQPRLLPLIERSLKPGGTLLLKTDVTEYFDVIQRLLSASTILQCKETRRLDEEPMPGDYDSNFQRKAVEQGHPLHWQRWQKR